MTENNNLERKIIGKTVNNHRGCCSNEDQNQDDRLKRIPDWYSNRRLSRWAENKDRISNFKVKVGDSSSKFAAETHLSGQAASG